MISLDKCKTVNDAPNIIIRSDERWTHGAQSKGLGHKGVEYQYFECDLALYNKAKLFGGMDFWDKNDGYNMSNFKEADIRAWVNKEEVKLREKIKNSRLER